MLPREIIKKIRRIEIHTSRIVTELLAGQWNSAFKGRGIEFEEVRPYQIGDDMRAIDWNVTARKGRPFIKLFREERELSVMLLVDMSASQSLGTHWQTKRELVTELGATLAFSAIKGNDKVGLTLFTDAVEKFVPPRKGTRHVLRIIRELLYCEPIGQGTSLRTASQHLNPTASRRTAVFLVRAVPLCFWSATFRTQGTSGRSRSRAANTISSRWSPPINANSRCRRSAW